MKMIFINFQRLKQMQSSRISNEWITKEISHTEYMNLGYVITIIEKLINNEKE